MLQCLIIRVVTFVRPYHQLVGIILHHRHMVTMLRSRLYIPIIVILFIVGSFILLLTFSKRDFSMETVFSQRKKQWILELHKINICFLHSFQLLLSCLNHGVPKSRSVLVLINNQTTNLIRGTNLVWPPISRLRGDQNQPELILQG